MMFRQKGMSVVNFLVLVLVCMDYNDSSQLVSGEVRCVETEREALLRFKNQLTDEYGVLSTWGSEDSKKECCKWKGVVCTNTNTTSHVIALRLGLDTILIAPYGFQPMEGNINDALLELSHLTYLDLSFNSIDQLPQFIGSMKQLKHLNLRDCSLSGTVPPQLGNLTNLRTLDLSSNSALRSENLDWLSHLSSLTRLDLSYSYLLSHHASWFPQILKLRSLQELDLSYSNISAIVPPFPFAKNNSSLTYLDLSWNSIDQLPQFIGSMKQLKHLYLQYCGLSGTVPPQLGNLTNLRTLDLSFNFDLRSENLDWLSHLSSLTRLDLSYSFDLSQTSWFPQILKLRSLQELRLSYCNISAIVPPFPFAKNNSSLSILDLSYNEITSSKELVYWLFNISTSLAEIYMAGNDLDGPLPVVFGEMIYLEHLDLSHNMLEGVIPKSLGNLTHLQTLSLSYNEFGGDLEELFGSNSLVGLMPQSLSHSSSLEELDLSFNLLEGTISEAYFTNLHNLKLLRLSSNRLTLQIAQDWIPPFQLNVINLGGCKMRTRNFPKWIQTQRNLRVLDLSDTGISDEVPIWLWSFSSALRELNISHNHISGTIPHLSPTSIFSFDVSSNKLSGPLPLLPQNSLVVLLSQNMFSGSISSICSLQLYNVRFLDLSNNHFYGEIPNCWDKMTYLQYLNLGDNSFSGEIPITFGTLGDLHSLQLRGNNLYGDLPSTLRNFSQLMFIDVGGNKLTGNIPAWIGGWNSNLMYVILSGNKFHGSIPREICNLTSIRVLDLSRNNISGEIPHCFNKLISLTQKNIIMDEPGTFLYNPVYWFQTLYEYTSVQWKGGEFEYKKLLKHLRLIDLSSNRLVGTIPESFSSMRELVSLNLSRNMLEGTIISRIGEMEMLEVLDLSRNKLSGHIPISLAQLHFLAVLDLANNSLLGKIPSSTQLQSFNASVYDGNDELCGRPLKLCPEDVPNKQGKDMKEDGGSVSLSFMQGFVISIVMGFIVGFWGVVGSLVLKRSWRYAYFNFLDEIKDWLCIKAAILSKASTPT